MTFFSLFYQYIVFPFKTIQMAPRYQPVSVMAVVLIGYAMTQVFHVTLPNKGVLGVFFFILFGHFLLLFIQSTTIDFMAQCFRLKPQSLRLLVWFGVAYLPLFLEIPLRLGASVGLSPVIVLIARVGLIITMIIYQFYTIKTLYQVTAFRGILLFLSPLFIISGLVFLVVAGSSLWLFSLGGFGV